MLQHRAGGVEEIDSLNILQATLLAMRRAVDGLRLTPVLVLVDGNRLPVLRVQAEAIVEGDATVASISAASILAKVHRDRMLPGPAPLPSAVRLRRAQGLSDARAPGARCASTARARRTAAALRRCASLLQGRVSDDGRTAPRSARATTRCCSACASWPRDPGGYRKLGEVWIEGDHLCAAFAAARRPGAAGGAHARAAWHDPALRALADTAAAQRRS